MRTKSKTIFLKYKAESSFEDKVGGERKNGKHGIPCRSISGIQGELSRADWQLDVESVGFGNGKKRIGFGKQNGWDTKIQDRENKYMNKLRSELLFGNLLNLKIISSPDHSSDYLTSDCLMYIPQIL